MNEDANFDIAALARGIMAGEKPALARGITLVESTRPGDRCKADELTAAVQHKTGKAMRVAFTGPAGVGKSTLIDGLGRKAVTQGHRLAVLAIDPSSARSGGSLLGDKTRMPNLAQEKNAFIRPSPAAGSPGGVAARTREAMLLCEAAGHDIVFIETVGTGQSELAAADLVDVFVVLMLAGAGDELQGLKKGVIELADIIAVTKSDGDNAARATAAAADVKAALGIFSARAQGWQAPVHVVSAAADSGLVELLQSIEVFFSARESSGELQERRAEQAVRWFRNLLELNIRRQFFARAGQDDLLAALEEKVRQGSLAPESAVAEAIQSISPEGGQA